MSCSGLTRASKNTRHNLTICTQKATRFNKGPRRSRCCGQAGYSLSCLGLFFFLSCSGLTRTSMAPRVVLRLPEDDKENTRLGLSNSLRASTKVRATASLRSRASPCQAGNSLQGNEKKTRCFFTKATAFSRLTKFIRLSDRSEPEFDASVHSRAVVRG